MVMLEEVSWLPLRLDQSCPPFPVEIQYIVLQTAAAGEETVSVSIQFRNLGCIPIKLYSCFVYTQRRYLYSI